jgi:hypothetical protein
LLHGKDTDRAPQISAIDADPHGNTETRDAFTREHSPEQPSDSSLYRQVDSTGEENVGYNGTPTDSDPPISATDAGSNGITDKPNDLARKRRREQIAKKYIRKHYGLFETPPGPTTIDLSGG